MTSFPTYDAESDSIRLNGSAGIMRTLLMKAKFGEAFDPIVLFHSGVSELIRQLDAAASDYTYRPGEGLDRLHILVMAEAVFGQSIDLGWSKMAADDRERVLQDAAAPWILSGEQIECIVDEVEAMLSRSRQVVATAAESDQTAGSQ